MAMSDVNIRRSWGEGTGNSVLFFELSANLELSLWKPSWGCNTNPKEAIISNTWQYIHKKICSVGGATLGSVSVGRNEKWLGIGAVRELHARSKDLHLERQCRDVGGASWGVIVGMEQERQRFREGMPMAWEGCIGEAGWMCVHFAEGHMKVGQLWGRQTAEHQ